MTKINKLFRFFLKLNSQKYKDISLWLNSSYQNTDKDALILWEYLVKNPPTKKDNVINKEDFFQKVFPNESYDEARLRNTMSNLIKQWVLYWKYQWVVNSPIGEIEFANDLSYNNQYIEDMIPILSQVEKALKNEMIYSVDYYYQWYLLRKTQIYSHTMGNNDKESQKVIHYLIQSIETLDVFYFTAQLKHHLLFIINRQNIQMNKGAFMIETADLLRYAEEQSDILAQNPLLNVYYLLLKTYYSREEEVLDRLLDLYYKEVLTYFSQNDVTQITGMITWLIRFVDVENRDKKLLDFMLNDLELKITFEKGSNGYMRSSRLYNVMRMGIDIYGIPWLEGYLIQKKEQIEPQYKDLILLLSKILIDLYQQNYRKATKAIALFNGERNVKLNVSLHTIHLMVLCKIVEKEGEDAMTEMQNTAKRFMTIVENDASVAAKVKENRITFMNIICKLAKLSYTQKSKLEKLQDICRSQNPIEKVWLLKEIALKISKI